ncbi:MAG: DUF4157 domain-containing protein [Desulfamplus sp.]
MPKKDMNKVFYFGNSLYREDAPINGLQLTVPLWKTLVSRKGLTLSDSGGSSLMPGRWKEMMISMIHRPLSNRGLADDVFSSSFITQGGYHETTNHFMPIHRNFKPNAPVKEELGSLHGKVFSEKSTPQGQLTPQRKPIAQEKLTIQKPVKRTVVQQPMMSGINTPLNLNAVLLTDRVTSPNRLLAHETNLPLKEHPLTSSLEVAKEKRPILPHASQGTPATLSYKGVFPKNLPLQVKQTLLSMKSAILKHPAPIKNQVSESYPVVWKIFGNQADLIPPSVQILTGRNVKSAPVTTVPVVRKTAAAITPLNPSLLKHSVPPMAHEPTPMVAAPYSSGIALPLIQLKKEHPVHIASSAPVLNTRLISILRQPGEPLQPPIRREMEHLFQMDFSDVRIHRGQAAAQATNLLGAKAATIGRNIMFAENRYDDGSVTGRALITHELTHVAQNRGLFPQLGALPSNVTTTPWEDQALHNEMRILQSRQELPSPTVMMHHPAPEQGYAAEFVTAVPGLPAGRVIMHAPQSRMSTVSSVTEPPMRFQEASTGSLPMAKIERISLSAASGSGMVAGGGRTSDIDNITTEVLARLRRELVIERERNGGWI